MKLSEFKCSHRRPDATIVIWEWRETVETDIGQFRLHLVFPPGDMTPPGDEMFKAANELIEAAKANSAIIGDILYGSYKAAVENDAEWVEEFMPLDVRKEEIGKHIGEPSLDVSLYEPDPESSDPLEQRGGLRQSISINPEWDEEHGVGIGIEDGAITKVNGSNYRLEDGFLRLEDDE